MESVDRGDVDISKLFVWAVPIAVQDTRSGAIVLEAYLRLVGDAELNRARVFSLRKSAELRKKLRTPDSDERLAFIPQIEEMDKDQIIETIVLYSINEFAIEAIRNVHVPYPKELPSDVTLEQQEKYQQEVDEYPEKRQAQIKEYIENRADTRRKELAELDKKEVFQQLEDQIVDTLCEAEASTKFREMCVYFGTYLDEDFTKRAFESFEQFDNFPRETKDQFLNAYYTLEVDGEELKKSLEVPQ